MSETKEPISEATRDWIEKLTGERDRLAALVARYEALNEEQLRAINRQAAQVELARRALEHLAYVAKEQRRDYARQVATDAIAKLSDPAAARTEHDERVAERCLEILNQSRNSIEGLGGRLGGASLCCVAEAAIRREFGLEAQSDQRNDGN